jgi:hypothetical protein
VSVDRWPEARRNIPITGRIPVEDFESFDD